MYVVRLNYKDWINIFITNLGCLLMLKAISQLIYHIKNGADMVWNEQI